MADYIINYKNGGANANVTLTPGGTAVLASMNLMGQNYANYGTNLNQNWVSIAENWASNASITNPVTGQLWYNNGNLQLNTGSQASPSWQTIALSSGSGNISFGNITVNSVTANTFNGDGSNITNLNANNISSGTINPARLSGTYDINITGSANTANTVTQSAQPNITSVGTLTSLSVTGNASAGNVAGGNLVSANFLTGTLTTQAQPNITSVGNLSSLNVTGNLNVGGTIVGNFAGNITGNLVVPGANTEVIFNNSGNAGASNSLRFNGTQLIVTGGVLATYLNGDGANISNVSAGSILGTVPTAVSVTGALQPNITTVGPLTGLSVTNPIVGNITGSAATAGTVTNPAQGNITSVGTLTSLAVGGALTTTNITTGANTTAGTLTGNWTLSAGSRLEATYADLAEYYSGDELISPGMVVEFGGSHEVTVCNTDASTRVAGVVSTQPAYVMNKEIATEYVVCVALQGRVPCGVVGPVRKGDMLVSAGNGAARAEGNPAVGSVIGKSLVDKLTDEYSVIEVAVGRI